MLTRTGTIRGPPCRFISLIRKKEKIVKNCCRWNRGLWTALTGTLPALLLLALVARPVSGATAFNVGDLLVVDAGAADGSGGVIRINPTTGDHFVSPNGLTLAPDGSLIVADPGTEGGTGSIIRVDPATGAQTVISTGDKLVDPWTTFVEKTGKLLVADPGTIGDTGNILR